MVCRLCNKHFGDKVFLHDLDNIIVKKMLKILHKNNTKIPDCGMLVRFNNNMVGLSVTFIDKDGHVNYLEEPSMYKTISSWASFHTNSKKYNQ